MTNPLAVADKLPKLEEVTDETPVSDAIDAASIARSEESIDWAESAMSWKGCVWTPKNPMIDILNKGTFTVRGR